MSGFHDAAAVDASGAEADFVVVGSGAGGSAAARALAGAGRSVIVLEEGPLPRTSELSPVWYDAMTRLYRRHGKQVVFGRATIPMMQGRVVGGTTFVNSAIVWRLPGWVLRKWHEEHGLSGGLPAAALDEAYEVLEREMSANTVAAEVAGRSSELMHKGAERAGIDGRYMTRYDAGCRGSARCGMGCPNEAKQSATLTSLRTAVASGADLFHGAAVERIVTSGGRAVGVAGRVDGTGAPFFVHARRAVIVAASAVQSPALLWRSGFRARGRLGERFMAHPGSTVMGVYPSRVNMWRGAAQGYEAIGLRDTLGVKFESINVPPEIVMSRLPGAGRTLASWGEKLGHVAAWAVAVRADATGSVRPSRIFGELVRYSPSTRDFERLREGMKRLAEMHFLAGADAVLPGIKGMPEVLHSLDELARFDEASTDPRAWSSVIATHLFGGCAAGADPRESVVGPDLRVHGTDNVYVMDASVFPTNTGVNPQHSIMAVARVAASRLA